jgi:hypothetical protein
VTAPAQQPIPGIRTTADGLLEPEEAQAAGRRPMPTKGGRAVEAQGREQPPISTDYR